MNKWSNRTLSDLIELQRGHDLPTQDRNPGIVPIIGSFGITGTHDKPKYLGPGVAIGRSGASIGQATFVDEPYWPLNTCLFVKNFNGNDPRWIYRLLDEIDFTAFNSGSAQPSLNRNFLRNIPVLVPPLNEQKEIAEVLGAFDEKIAANFRLSKLAAEVADALFERSLASTQVRWVPLGSVATTVLGGTPSKENSSYWTGGTVPWLNSGKANEDRIIQPSAYITSEALQRSAAKVMPVGTTLIAITGATLGQVARLEIEASGNQSLVGIWAVDQQLNDWLYFSIRDQISQLLTRATGAAQQHVNKRDVEALNVPVADAANMARFFDLVHPLLQIAVLADRENVALTDTRNALLPQLMSGKIRIKDAQTLLEDAEV